MLVRPGLGFYDVDQEDIFVDMTRDEKIIKYQNFEIKIHFHQGRKFSSGWLNTDDSKQEVNTHIEVILLDFLEITCIKIRF